VACISHHPVESTWARKGAVLDPELLSRALRGCPTWVASLRDRRRRMLVLGRKAVLCHQEVAMVTPLCAAKSPLKVRDVEI
jgi:hypothetical protein